MDWQSSYALFDARVGLHLHTSIVGQTVPDVYTV